MKKLFLVELSVVAVALAEDEYEAEKLVRDDARQIVSECPDLDADVVGAVETAAQLRRHGWDDQCLPYGGDGSSTIADYLKGAA